MDIKIEKFVLGALIVNPGLSEVIPNIKPEYFTYYQNKMIFDVIRILYDEHIPADLITITDKLSKNGNLEMSGGSDYIMGLCDVPVISNIDSHIQILKDSYQRLGLKQVAEQILLKADTVSVNDITRDSINSLVEIEMNKEHLDQKYMQFAYFDQLENPHVCYPSGLKDLDIILGGGFERKNLVIVAARPSLGKTALLTTIARNHHHKPLIFSIEMSYNQIVNRIMAAELNINGYAIKHRDPTSVAKIAHNIGKLNDYIIDDDTNLDVGILKEKIKSAKKKEQIYLVMIDYLQLMLTHTDGSRNDQVSAITRAIKLIAKETDTCIILLSQLSRSVETRGDKRPILSDLRDSGAIEQDADQVIFIHGDIETTERELIVAKNREGQTGSTKVNFDGRYTKFYDKESNVF